MVAVREATIVVRHDKRMGVTTIEVSDGVAVVKPANTLLAAINLRAGQQAVIDAENMDAPPAADVADVAATDLPSDTAVDTRTEIASITGAAGADATAGAATPAATDAAAETTALAAPATAADLNGSWLTNDGSVVQLTQSGNQVSWNYRGPAGHETRVGTVSATFDGKFLVGTFLYTEGSETGNGTLTLTADGSNRLVGGWIATSPPGAMGQEILTRQ
ncbi:MAG: hypothetical protein JO032_10345 [Alphaproteobacteria bacterium]|nr:hypothetical protein [Alphaproteobacteria bacterium]